MDAATDARDTVLRTGVEGVDAGKRVGNETFDAGMRLGTETFNRARSTKDRLANGFAERLRRQRGANEIDDEEG